MTSIKRHLLTALGLVFLALGIVGALLPILPTTPFLLAAMACFSRSFPRLETWMLNHPRLGAPLRDWRRHGAIATSAKCLALATMSLSMVVFMMTVEAPVWGKLGFMAVLAVCALFIVTRPNPAKLPLPDHPERQG